VTPIIIALAGGTGSGKTSFARLIAERVGEEKTLLLSQDAYYYDPSHLPFEERAKINYDHPDAYETELLLDHLDALKRGEPIPRLSYDYVRHARVTLDEPIEPRPIVLLEGILVLESASLRQRFDIKLYIDTDADVRVLRRLRRDMLERGRSLESVTEQYLSSVRPMHLEFIVPSKRYADLIIPEGAENQVALDIVVARIQELATGR
jgi:uridine kinase